MSFTNNETEQVYTGLFDGYVPNGAVDPQQCRDYAESVLADMISSGDLMAGDRADYLNAVDWDQIADLINGAEQGA